MAAFAVLTIGALGLSACGSGGSSSGSSGESEETGGGSTESSGGTEGAGNSSVEKAEQVVEEASTKPTEVLSAKFGSFKPKSSATIFFIGCDDSVEGCANQHKGVEEGTKAIGYSYEDCIAGATDPEGPEKCFKNAIAAKPDAILVNGIGTETAAAGYEDALSAGIPVIGMFTGNKAGEDTTEVTGGCVDEGIIIGSWDIADSGGTAKALVPYTKAYPCPIQTWEGIKETLEECSECEVKPIEFDVSSIETQLPSLIQSQLTSNPEFKYVNGTFSPPALIASDAVRQAGKTEVQVTGVDGAAPNLENVRHGGQSADITVGNREPGWAAVDAAARAIAGEKLPPVVEVAKVLITKENIEEFPSPENYRGPEGYEQQYKELWGK